MTRVWCLFELASFAKRNPLQRLVVLPIHMALKRAALSAMLVMTAIMNALYSAMSPSARFMGLADMAQIVMYNLSISPAFLLLLHACVLGQDCESAIDRLQHFRLCDAECYSKDDRENIIALISHWWDDSHGAHSHSSALGRHNFERFVRKDVYSKIHGGGLRRSHIGWPQDLTLLLALAFGAQTGVEASTCPEATLHQMAYLLAVCAATYASAAVGGAVACNMAAAAVRHARTRWGWGTVAAYLLIGWPCLSVGLNVVFGVPMSLLSVQTPWLSENGSAVVAEALDDGLDPGWPRRSTKLNILTVLVVLLAAMLRV